MIFGLHGHNDKQSGDGENPAQIKGLECSGLKEKEKGNEKDKEKELEHAEGREEK